MYTYNKPETLMETPSISPQGMCQIVISNVIIGTTQKPISDMKL